MPCFYLVTMQMLPCGTPASWNVLKIFRMSFITMKITMRRLFTLAFTAHTGIIADLMALDRSLLAALTRLE